MTYLVLHADQSGTTLTDDPIVPSSAIAPLEGALALLRRAKDIHAAAEASSADVVARAERAGYDAGYAKGRAAGSADVAAELLRIADRDAAHVAGRRHEVAQLALGVVRRIADGLDGEMVASLAQHALEVAGPTQHVVVRVAPSAIAATRARLGERPGIGIEADASLAEHDCMIETALGRVIAGLDAQLARIEAAWGDHV